MTIDIHKVITGNPIKKIIETMGIKYRKNYI